MLDADQEMLKKTQIMQDFFDTTRYVGPVVEWETLPELGTSEDEDEDL